VIGATVAADLGISNVAALAAAAEQARKVDHPVVTANLSRDRVALPQIVARVLQVQEIAALAVVVVMLAAEIVVATTTGPDSNRRRPR
jgi:hypothetical protein